MEMSYFNEFVELARIGSYTVASHNLHISQSVLSKHIKVMEGELGAQLFVRGKRGVELSEYGFLLLPYANQIMNIRETYIEKIDIQRQRGGVLKVASIPGVKQLGIGNLIAGFVKGNPNVTVNILEEESAFLIDCLQKQECDLAFARGIDNRYSELVRIPFMSDHIIAMLPRSHPLAGKEEVQLSELRYEDLIFSGKDTYTYNMVYEACLKEGFEPNVVYTNNNGRHSIEMVERCVGIVLAHERPSSTFLNEYRDICKIRIVPLIESTVYMYYHAKHIKKVAERFIEYIIEKDHAVEETL